MPVKATRKNRKAYFICPKCGLIGHARKIMPGNRVTELLLWIIFFFPGPVYSAWRHFNQTLICFKCGNPDIIAVDSNQGEKLFQKSLHNDFGITEPNASAESQRNTDPSPESF